VPRNQEFLTRSGAGHEEQTSLALQVLPVRLLVILNRGDGIGGWQLFGAYACDAHASVLEALHPMDGPHADGVVVFSCIGQVGVRYAARGARWGVGLDSRIGCAF